MTDSKESYEKLLKDFLEEQELLVELTDEDFKLLPEVNEHADIMQQEIYYDSIKDVNDPGSINYRKFLDEWTDRDFHIFSDQSQIKYHASPGKFIAEIAMVISSAAQVLPHEFKVVVREVDYYEEWNSIYSTIIFIDEKLLETIN